MTLLDLLPRFIGRTMVPTLGSRFTYIERWMPGSRSRARAEALRAAGMTVTSGPVTVPCGPGVTTVVTEIRVTPAPGLAAIPAIEETDALPTTTTPEQRGQAARERASVEHSGADVGASR